MPIVFITGSGRRIGRALAYRFAEKGWDVAINYKRSAEAANVAVQKIEELGRKAIAIKADVSLGFEMELAFEQCVQKLGVPDVLINNAGVFPKQMSLTEITDDVWHYVLDTNTKGVFNSVREYSKIAKKGAKVINISSLGAFQVWKGRIPYHVSKAGVYKLTKVLASELAPNIAVNSVSPGIIEVEGEPAADSSGVPVNKIPMERYGNVDDLFDAVYFFATCSNFITGQNVNVDGGYHLDI